MTERKIAPGLEAVLEYGPLVLFFIGVQLVKGQSFWLFGEERSGFIIMSLLLVPLLAASALIMWRMTGKVPMMQIFTLVLVTALAAMGFWLNDPRFLKVKPTIVYLLFTAILGFGLLRGKSYLQLVMGKKLKMSEEGWMIFTKRFTALFLGLAITNEVVWRMVSTETWVSFKVFGTTAIMFLFIMSQAKLLDTYAEKDDVPGADPL
ncbi:MAG: inner membrane-spanning protein YciB [Deltaproteobacteria bacterium]